MGSVGPVGEAAARDRAGVRDLIGACARGPITVSSVSPERCVPNPARFLDEQLAQASPDLLRQMLTTFINTLMSAQADAVCGAEYGARSAERINTRNGYRPREFDTRAGTLEVAIPKLRSGSYFPDWLLERRRRAVRAPSTPGGPCSLLGCGTRA